VSVSGKLVLMQPDGAQELLADDHNSAALATDGRHVAFTIGTATTETFVVMNLATRTQREILTLPQGAHLRDIDWAPNGRAMAYQVIVPGKSDDLFLAPFPPERGPPHNLGHWYQPSSFSRDGSQIVHAVNRGRRLESAPASEEPGGFDLTGTGSGLEVLDVTTGERTVVHETQKVVWDARFSPDGRSIAYLITLHEPPPSDEPDCTPPTLGLRLYSVAAHSDVPVTIRDAPPGWEDVRNWAWSPDSKRIAVALGTTDCDYPGTASGVFVTSLDLKSQVRASTSRLSVEPAFSPDGGAVAFVDFSESPAKLLRYDLATGKLTLIRRATESENDYRLLSWR